jgi:hypothetical protein
VFAHVAVVDGEVVGFPLVPVVLDVARAPRHLHGGSVRAAGAPG